MGVIHVDRLKKNMVLSEDVRDLNTRLILAKDLKIQAKHLNAPRLNPDMIEATIVGEEYYVFPGTTLTICKLDLANGYHVVGESAAVSLENFDKEIGQKIARDNAKNKIWTLEGYLLKQNIFEGKVTTATEPRIIDTEFYTMLNPDTMNDELHLILKYDNTKNERITIVGSTLKGDMLPLNRKFILGHIMNSTREQVLEWLSKYGRVEVVK